VLDREELADEPVVRRRNALTLRAGLETEAHDREHDAALLVDDGVAPVPDVAIQEAAFVEAFRRVVERAVAYESGGLQAVLETRPALRLAGRERLRGRLARPNAAADA
jgi:hypothetical protein